MTYTPQSDLNHNTPLDPDHRYGCFNRDDMSRTVSHMPDGFYRGLKQYKVIRTEWLPVGCAHSYKSTDPACSGCKWR